MKNPIIVRATQYSERNKSVYIRLTREGGVGHSYCGYTGSMLGFLSDSAVVVEVTKSGIMCLYTNHNATEELLTTAREAIMLWELER